MQNEDGATAGRQIEQGPSHQRPGESRGLLVGRGSLHGHGSRVSPPHRAPAVAIAAEVDGDANEPRLAAGLAVGNATDRGGRAEKCLLDEVPGLLRITEEAHAEPVKTAMVRVEQRAQPFFGVHGAGQG